MADRWYYQHDGQTRGPVSVAEMRDLLAHGALVASDRVWGEGESPEAAVAVEAALASPSPAAPDWLSDIQTAEQANQEVPFAESAGAPDWLEDVRQAEQELLASGKPKLPPPPPVRRPAAGRYFQPPAPAKSSKPASPPPVRREDSTSDRAIPIARPVSSHKRSSKLLWILLGGSAALLLLGGLTLAAFLWFWREQPQPDMGGPPANESTASEATEPKPAKTPDRNARDLRYIGVDFTGAAILHPRRTLEAPALAALPRDQWLGMIVKETGLDPRKMEQVVLLLKPLPSTSPPAEGKIQRPGDFPAMVGGICRFSEAIDVKQVLATSFKAVQEATFLGKTYYRSTNTKVAGVSLAGCAPDDRTLLLAPEPMLLEMLAAGEVKSPLTDRLRVADLDDDLLIVFLPDPFRALAASLLNDVRAKIPPPLAEVTTLPVRLKSATLSINLTKETLVQLSLEADSDESAAVLEELARNGLRMLQEIYPGLRDKLVKETPPLYADRLRAVGDQLLTGVTIGRDGARVTASLKRPDWPAAQPQGK